MIRVTTDRAIDALLAAHRKDTAARTADDIVRAIETLLPLPCDHRDRPSCPKCAQRRAVFAAAAIARKTGGAS